ncbi:phage tail tape measure protein [Campylobacter sp. RM12640]|uniref:phage tail tape measure protein n=1 Tax=unclassified Campylobacter TaxID=2593542 RepID=UPI003015664E|nr:phage tail tape measure protein [Campylobacter sp. RM12640]MBZ7989937.1 phage tail tape measure protein [Campylobacter sp. RM12635]
MDMQFGLGLKLALGGFDKLKTQQERLEKLGKIAKLSTDKMNNLTKSINKLNNLDIKAGLAKEKLQAFKDDLTKNIAKAGALAVPVKLAGDYESALADFNNAAKLDNAGLKDMNEYFLSLSNKVNISSAELANLGQNIAKMGVPKNDLKEYLNTASKLQMALSFSTDETNEMLSTLNTHFKLNSKDALNFGDEIFTLSNKFSASAKSIAQLTSKISANAKMFGLSANESAVLSAAFLQVAKDEGQAENSINSLNEKLMNITSLGDNVKQSLANLGMDAQQIEIGMKIDPKATLDLFFNRLKITKKANEKQYNELLVSMFGGNASIMNAFVENLDKYNEATANIGKNKGALDDEAKAIKELFNTRVGVFTNQLKTLSIQIGNVFLPIVSSVIDKLSSVLSFTSDMMSKYPTLTKVVVGTAGAFMSLQVVLSTARAASALLTLSKVNMAKNMIYAKNVAMILGGVLKKNLWLSLVGAEVRFRKAAISSIAFSKSLITSSISKSKSALMGLASLLGGGLSKAFKFGAAAVRVFNLALASNPIGLIAVAITSLGVLIYSNWDRIKSWTKSLCSFLARVFAKPIESIKGLFGGLWSGVKSLFNTWLDNFKRGVSIVSEFFSSPIESIKSLFSGLWDSICNSFSAFTNIFSVGAKSLGEFFSSPIEFIKSKFSAIFDWIASKFAWITDTFSSITDFFGFGDEKESKKTPQVISSKEIEQLNTAVMSAKSEIKQDFTINLSFGEIKIATNNGNFDLNALTAQITQAVTKAIDKANANAQNRSIVGG